MSPFPNALSPPSAPLLAPPGRRRRNNHARAILIIAYERTNDAHDDGDGAIADSNSIVNGTSKCLSIEGGRSVGNATRVYDDAMA